MNDFEDNSHVDVAKLARSIRFAIVAIVLGASYFSLRSSLAISNFEQIFHDMLGNRPLPGLTAFVIGARSGFVAISTLVPVVAFGTLFSRRVIASFYILGSLCFVSTVQFILLCNALSAPLALII